MYKTILVFLFSVFIGVNVCNAEQFGVVANVIGTVDIYSAKRNSWKQGRINQKIFVNDKIRTQRESIAEIRSEIRNIIRVGENSEILIVSNKDKNGNRIRLNKGKVWANMKKLISNHRKFAIQTPVSTAAIRGTILRVNVNADSSTDVLVYEGLVDVGPSNHLKSKLKKSVSVVKEVNGPVEISGPHEVSLTDWVSIVAGQQISVSRDGSYNKFNFDKDQDKNLKWVKYNIARDKLIKNK